MVWESAYVAGNCHRSTPIQNTIWKLIFIIIIISYQLCIDFWSVHRILKNLNQCMSRRLNKAVTSKINTILYELSVKKLKMILLLLLLLMRLRYYSWFQLYFNGDLLSLSWLPERIKRICWIIWDECFISGCIDNFISELLRKTAPKSPWRMSCHRFYWYIVTPLT